jgi:hypothetical protein
MDFLICLCCIGNPIQSYGLHYRHLQLFDKKKCFEELVPQVQQSQRMFYSLN